jgi:hypothetical protein
MIIDSSDLGKDLIRNMIQTPQGHRVKFLSHAQGVSTRFVRDMVFNWKNGQNRGYDVVQIIFPSDRNDIIVGRSDRIPDA